MASKSEKRSERISATEASRSFSTLLDRVASGYRFLIHRRGRDVCVMAPPPLEARRASDCLALLRGRAAVTLDSEFSQDLLDVIATEALEEPPRWDS